MSASQAVDVTRPRATGSEAAAGISARSDLRSALDRLAEASIRYAAVKADTWTRQLERLAEPAGAADRATVEAVKAWATGGNPLRAALRGAWAAADAKTKVALVASLLLVAVLAPVVLLLLLLGLLIVAVVARIRAATR